jgi:hypothetical protein
MMDGQKRAIIIPVKDGYASCPYCGIRPETRAENLQIYCRRCKRELIVNIAQGQCYQSQCR